MRSEDARVGQRVRRPETGLEATIAVCSGFDWCCHSLDCGKPIREGDLLAEHWGGAYGPWAAFCLACVEPVEPGDYRQARGAVPWQLGDELPEQAIRRLRDGEQQP